MTHETSSIGPEAHVNALLERYDVLLTAAVATGYPERAGEDALTVFPEPTSPREAAPAPDWDEQQQVTMRGLTAELGYGRTTDRSFAEAGLPAQAHVIYEAGQPHKVNAEVLTVANDATAEPLSHIFAGNPSYLITNPAEQASAQRQCGLVPENQYELARTIAQQTEGFVPLEGGEQVLPLAYDIDNGHAVSNEASGQLTMIGTIKNKPVILLRIDQRDFIDDKGEPKFRNRPGPADVVRIVSQCLARGGDTENAIAFVTSATYQPSRELEGVRAGLETDRIVGVPTYGTDRLAAVKGEPMPAPAPINQLPGELHAAAKSVAALRTLLQGRNTRPTPAE